MDELTRHIEKSTLSHAWKRVGIGHHHGILVILSSLVTKNSCGIGEFFDLLPLIDWCKEVGLDVIQLLPLNDSENDPSPYNGISSCALNPIYISLQDIPNLERHPALKKSLDQFLPYNLTPKVAYASVRIAKIQWLKEFYEKEHSRIVHTEKFRHFIHSNSWLEPYALFKVIKNSLGGIHWHEWPHDLRTPTHARYKELLKKHHNEMTFYKFLQYLAHEQMLQVAKYSQEKKVHIMGDIPILISPDSVDVWHHRNLFELRLAAGAPPDEYSKEGQYWGFPLFHWDELKKEDYRWWRDRLHYSANFYEIFRIDHVVGIFRIWGIPLGDKPSAGRFIPEDTHLWIPEGRERLFVIGHSSQMLPIAEDLGTIPDGVRETLLELAICGTKVMRWERYWHHQEQEYIPYSHYPPLSLTCISTHDSETISIWWKNQPHEAMAFAKFKHWDYNPTLSQEQRKEILWDSHHTGSLFHVNPLQEYLALFPELCWENPEDERINVPGTVRPTNWTYRFACSLEKLTAHEPLKTVMRAIHV